MNAPMQPDRLTARPGATDPRPRGMAIRPTARLSRRRGLLVFALLLAMRTLHAGLRVCARTVDTLEGRRL